LFAVLGSRPALGRVFTPDDDREGAPGTLVISHGLWQSRFGGDPGVLGRKVILDGEPSQIIGVMPPGFLFPSRETQLWKAFRFKEEDFVERDNNYVQVLARLRPGVSIDQARAEGKVLAARLEVAFPKENARFRVNIMSLRDELSRQARLLLFALFGAAVCVLLSACTNLAGLLVARGLFRRKEIAVRAALGAGQERLVRQLLTESLVLALCGGALGVALAAAAGPLVARLVPNAPPVARTPGGNLRVLLFSALAPAVTGVGFRVRPPLPARPRAEPAGP